MTTNDIDAKVREWMESLGWVKTQQQYGEHIVDGFAKENDTPSATYFLDDGMARELWLDREKAVLEAQLKDEDYTLFLSSQKNTTLDTMKNSSKNYILELERTLKELQELENEL
jgi:hypothetical protein